MWCGRFEDTEVVVPQGRPLSPLCANIILNELDHELERRGHSIAQYADDMVIFCGSKASAKQTLEHIVPFIEKKLLLKVNREKTVVAYAGKIKFLGYGFYKGKRRLALRVRAKSKAKMKASVRELDSRRTVNDCEKWKVDLKRYAVGWVNYYKLVDMGTYIQSIDEWMRRRFVWYFGRNGREFAQDGETY